MDLSPALLKPPVGFMDARPSPHPRLSLPFSTRLAMCAVISSFSGAALGLSHGSQTAGYRFRAEHAHKLPHSSTGWYLYHKSKNYNMLFGGVKEGFRMSGKVGFFVISYFSIEEAVDRIRGSQDFLSSVVGGLGVAGAFSLWNRFPMPVAARTARLGLTAGLGYGLLQDVLGWARGRRPTYLSYLLGSPGESEEVKSDA